jgi:Ca-activated chloride channel family protein
MKRASGPRAILVVGLVLSAALMRPERLRAQNGAYRSGVELVPLTVTVTDRSGRYVPNLTAADFAIFEDGRRQMISQFSVGRVPVDLGILLDTSSSMRDDLALAQKAASGLVRQLSDGDRGAVIGIASTVRFHQSLTSDLAHVEMALRSTQANGSTALYDAIYIALRQYQQERLSTSEVRRRAIVLLTDGIDTSSHVAFDDVLDLVRRAEVTVYVVSLAAAPAMLRGTIEDRTSSESAHALSTLARDSGGRLFTPRASGELPAIYDSIGQELSNQYVIGYVPSGPATDGAFRHISVGVLQPNAGIARTRAGYYADRFRAGNPVSFSRKEQ